MRAVAVVTEVALVLAFVWDISLCGVAGFTGTVRMLTLARCAHAAVL